MTRRAHGFSLVEVLVAVAIFAAVSAIAMGGLASVATTRETLAIEQDRFARLSRAMGSIARDLRQAIARPVRGNFGETLPAMRGSPDTIELSRLGFANPLAEARGEVERVIYSRTDATLQRSRFAVLDRAAGSVPDNQPLVDGVRSLRWRYLDQQGRWHDQWPRQQTGADNEPRQRNGNDDTLPRAVEMTLTLDDYGELRRIVALPSALPASMPRQSGPPSRDDDSVEPAAPPMFGVPMPLPPSGDRPPPQRPPSSTPPPRGGG